MNRIVRTSVCMLALTFAGSVVTPTIALAQDQEHHDMDRDRHDESAYMNNKYYKAGWQDGQRHKHKDRKWKNDADRQAYEAGYVHGDHGEQWQEHRDHDQH